MCKKRGNVGEGDIHREKRRRSNDQGIESYERERGKRLAMRNIQKDERKRRRNKKPFGVVTGRRS